MPGVNCTAELWHQMRPFQRGCLSFGREQGAGGDGSLEDGVETIPSLLAGSLTCLQGRICHCAQDVSVHCGVLFNTIRWPSTDFG